MNEATNRTGPTFRGRTPEELLSLFARGGSVAPAAAGVMAEALGAALTPEPASPVTVAGYGKDAAVVRLIELFLQRRGEAGASEHEILNLGFWAKGILLEATVLAMALDDLVGVDMQDGQLRFLATDRGALWLATRNWLRRDQADSPGGPPSPSPKSDAASPPRETTGE